MTAGAPDWSPFDLLPGLYAAALALALAAILGRFYDRVPRRVLLAAAAIAGVLFGSALFGGKVLLPLDGLRGSVPYRQIQPADPPGNPIQGDLIELVVPSLAAARRGLAADRWPLWNARAGAGMPLLADPQSQALAPLALLALPLSPVRGAAVMAALRIYLALVFMFLLLRRQDLGMGPALAGAIAYALSGFVVLWVGWPLASVAALLPAVLYAVHRLAAAAAAAAGRDALLLAAALAALLLAGHPETILYACLLAAGFAGEALWRQGIVGRGGGGCGGAGRGRSRLLGRYAVAALVAAGVAAPALLPALDYLPQTLRADRLAHPAAAGSSRGGDGALPVPAIAAATFNGIGGGGGKAGGRAIVPAAAAAPAAGVRRPDAGGAAAPAGAGGLAMRWLPIVAPNAYGNSRYDGYWGLRNTNEDAAGFAGTVMLLAALAAALPGAARRRWLPGEGVATAALALSLVMLADPAPLHRTLLALAPALAGSGRCLMIVAFCLAYLGACGLERQRRGQLDRLALLVAAGALAGVLAWAYLGHPAPGDPARLAILRLGWLRWQARFLIGATLLLALPAGLLARHRALRGLVASGLAAAVAAELLLAHAPAIPAMPARLAFPAPPPLAVMEVLGASQGERVAALGRALPPNLATMYGLDDARVYNPMAPAPYVGLLAPITAGWWGELPQLGAPAHPLYRRLGVRYLLTAAGERLPPPWRLFFARPAGWVYRQPAIAPRLYLAAGAVTPTAAAAAAGPGGGIVAAPPAAGGEPPPPLRGGLETRSFDEQEIMARLRPRGPAPVLVGSLYQDGGWRLLIDRRPVATCAAGCLLSAPVPAGARRLDLLYRPRGFVAGLLAAALAVAAGAALWLPATARGGSGAADAAGGAGGARRRSA